MQGDADHWDGLGDLGKAEAYLDAARRVEKFMAEHGAAFLTVIPEETK